MSYERALDLWKEAAIERLDEDSRMRPRVVAWQREHPAPPE